MAPSIMAKCFNGEVSRSLVIVSSMQLVKLLVLMFENTIDYTKKRPVITHL